MTIEIHRYEKFYTVRHKNRGTIGDTVVELPSFADMHEYIECLLQIARRQILEEVMITREFNEDYKDYIVAASKANDIIPTLDDVEEPVDEKGDL